MELPADAKLRAALDRLAAEQVDGQRPHALDLTTVATGHSEPFDPDDFYGDDER